MNTTEENPEPMTRESTDEDRDVEDCILELTELHNETPPDKGLADITGLDDIIAKCSRTLVEPHLNGHHTIAAKTAFINECPTTSDVDFAGAIAAELYAEGYDFARIDIKSRQHAHRYRDPQKLIPYIDAVIEEQPFVLIVDGFEIVEERDIAPFQKRLESISEENHAIALLGVHNGTHSKNNYSSSVAELMDLVLSVPEPDQQRKKDILKQTLSVKASKTDFTIASDTIDFNEAVTKAEDLNAHWVRKVADRAFLLAKADGLSSIKQTHIDKAVAEIIDERRDATPEGNSSRSNRNSKSRYTVTAPDVTFDDIGGLDDVINRIQSIVSIQQDQPELAKRAGFNKSHGMLLAGPPGTGKTLLAKAIANELNRTFLSVKGPELKNPWYGRTERFIRDLFDTADDNAPSVIFFDEFDVIAGERATATHSVTESIVATLLTELDGIEERENILVLAATNRPDAIDDALLRRGRIDEILKVPVPDTEAQAEIFGIHTDGLPMDESISCDWLVTQTPSNLTGADIQGICEEAYYHAIADSTGNENIVVTKTDFKQAISSITPNQSDQTEQPEFV